ncbi:hypothetical protein SEA_DIZZYRUDY_43 [Microbacterium phage DizzyRudy]|nr:hypothetical protein SEA_DIZZYRUDY_43 [Microbacterium phage DizzyRudy]
MATAARKARKRAGIKFEKAPKVPTPVMQRSYISEPVQGPYGTKNAGRRQMRSEKKVDRYLEGRTLNLPAAN